MLVLKEVNDIMSFAKTMKMPEKQTVELSNIAGEEVIGKVSSFWLETKQSWKALKYMLMKCMERASADIACLMEQYNCEGMYILVIYVQSFYDITFNM